MKKLVKKVASKPYITLKKILNYSKNKTIATEMLNSIEKTNKEEKKIWYFCAPIHDNLGDLAQRYCIENWILENYLNNKYIILPTKGIRFYGKKIISIINNKLNKDDIFIFQSGYTMTDYHPDDYVRKIILSNFNKNRCIIFPQTVLYNIPKKEESIKKVLNGVNNLKILARDEVSYKNLIEKMNLHEVELYPDIVTTLIGNLHFNNDRNGICVCVRNDGEKFYTDSDIKNLVSKLNKFEKIVDITDTNCNPLKRYDLNTIQKEIMNKIDSFSKYKVIITDRFHGTIFSLIAGTPVIVIKTNDHKVSTGVNWFKEIYSNYIYYCDNIEEIPNIVKNIFANKDINYQLTSYFKEKYYDKLK